MKMGEPPDTAVVKKTKPKNPTSSLTPIGKMVVSAIVALKDRRGSSMQAITKYIGSNYDIDLNNKYRFIKKFVLSAVISGILVQTKGRGATGSFKMPKPPAKIKETEAKPKKTNVKKKVVRPSDAFQIKTPKIKKVTKKANSKKVKIIETDKDDHDVDEEPVKVQAKKQPKKKAAATVKKKEKVQ